ncbi:hypothetical protein TKK_0008087 [Trichogramma kaykai]
MKRGNHSMVLHHLTQEYKRNKFTCLATVQLEIWPLPDASQMDNMLIFWITFFCAGNLGQFAVLSQNVPPQNDQMFNAHIKTFSSNGARGNLANLKHSRDIADTNFGISKFHFNINERYGDTSKGLNFQDHKNIFDSASSTIENQAINPNYDSFVGQQNYFVSQSDAAQNRNNFRATVKPLFNPYSKTSRSSPSVPVHKPLQYYTHQTLPSNNQQNIAKPSYRNLPYANYYASNLDNVRTNPKFQGSLNNHNKHFRNLDHNSYDNIHITTNSPLELPKTKVVPAVTNLLGTENFQNNMQSLEINPSILSAESGLQYRTEPGFSKAHDFRYHKPNNNNQKVKFSSYNDPAYTNPMNVLPLQTTNAPQLPKYKGAVVQPYANRVFAKFPNDYEEFKSQPLLHFNNKGNNSPIPFNDPPKKNKYKTGKIKPGIEIVTHSSPTSTIKEEDDENSYEESNNENKNIDSYLPRDEDDTGDEPEKYFDEPGFESNFKSSKTHIFKHYEEDFQNNNKPLSEAYHEDNTKDDNYQVNLAAKYRYNISENENDYDNEDVNKKSKKITTIKPESQYDFSGPYSEEEEDNTEERKKEENNSNSSLETISHETENSSKFPVKTYADSFYKNYKAKTKQNQASKTPKSGESRSYSSFHRVNSSPKTTRKNSRPNKREKLSATTSSFSLESPFQSADFDFPILKDNSFNSHKNTSYSRKTKWNNEGNKRHKNSRHTSEDVAREKSAEKSVLENLETFDY